MHMANACLASTHVQHAKHDEINLWVHWVAICNKSATRDLKTKLYGTLNQPYINMPIRSNIKELKRHTKHVQEYPLKVPEAKPLE